MALAPLRQPPIGFAHRGASAHAPENTLEAFTLGVRLGATGLESDVWLTEDAVPVLVHDGRVGVRRRRIADTPSSRLPDHIPTLADFYETIGPGLPLSLDMKDPAALDAVLGYAHDVGAAHNLWLCHPDWELVATWRRRSDDIHLVDSTALKRIKEGPERRAQRLRDAGIDSVNLHHADWSAGLVAMFHRFDVECFGWDLQQPAALARALSCGLDAVYSDHVDRMVDAIGGATIV